METKAQLTADEKSFNSILVLEGECEIDGIKALKGDSVFVTAGSGSYTVEGKCKAVLTKV